MSVIFWIIFVRLEIIYSVAVVSWGKIINTSKMNVNRYLIHVDVHLASVNNSPPGHTTVTLQIIYMATNQGHLSFSPSMFFFFFSFLKSDEGPRQGILGHDCISWYDLLYLNTHSVNPNYTVSYKFQPKTVGLTLHTHLLSQTESKSYIKEPIILPPYRAGLV